jgi:enamine deaminase RidA (YjgF/YER057c/UK114 family)
MILACTGDIAVPSDTIGRHTKGLIMGRIDDRLNALGLALPAPTQLPPGLELPFSFVNVKGARVLISGHPKSNADGSIGGPFGQLGNELTTQQGYDASREIALAILANIKAEIGDLDRIVGWTRVFGMVNSAPGYSEQHLVINGFSDLIIDVFGPEVGRHARSAIGTAGLPMNFAIEIEGEVEITP